MTQVTNSVDGFVTGVGRLLQGTPYEKQKTDYVTKQELPENKQKYYVGIGFDKTQDAITGFPGIWALMQQAAASHPAAAQFKAQNWNGFKFKYEDGDAPQHADKPGWKGHHILKFSNGFAPAILDENMNDVSQQPDAVYRGCYVRVVGSTKQNGASGAQAGIYMNFGTIQRVAHGERIQTGPDHRAMLAGAGAVQLPPGASAIPQATGDIPGAPGAAAAPAGINLPGVPGAGAAPVGAPSLPGMSPAPAPVAAPAPVDKQSLMNGGLDYATCIAQGWTDELLVAHGHMRAPAPVAPAAPPGLPAGIPAGGVPVSGLPSGVPQGAPSGLPNVPGAAHPYAQ